MDHENDENPTGPRRTIAEVAHLSRAELLELGTPLEDKLRKAKRGEVVEFYHVGVIRRTFEGHLPQDLARGHPAYNVSEISRGAAEFKIRAVIARRAKKDARTAAARLAPQ